MDSAKKLFIFIVCVMLALCLAACCAPALSESELKALDQKVTYPSAPGELSRIYYSIDEMIKDSPNIVRVSITDTEYEMLDEFPRTHSTAKVLDVYKTEEANSPIKPDSEIKIIEFGGRFPDGNELYYGVPTMTKGNEYLLFIGDTNEGKINPTSKGARFICGGFQGKFINQEDYYFQTATEDVKIKEYTPLRLEDFKEKYL